jgi:hypothetical protein
MAGSGEEAKAEDWEAGSGEEAVAEAAMDWEVGLVEEAGWEVGSAEGVEKEEVAEE